MIYLDSAATSLVKPTAVQSAVLRAMQSCASPGRGAHAPAMRAAETVFACRETAARLFHVPEPERVVFTANATHALNLAICSLAGSGSRVLISGYEHNSVTRPLRRLGAHVTVAEAPLFDSDAVLEAFSARIPSAELVVCTHVSNVFGFVLPIREIAGLCRKHGVPLIIDASQSAGVLDVDYEALGAAFIAMPGHKGLLGPQGTGILLCAQNGEPLLSGGSGSDSLLQTMPEYLPDRLEAGTHNVPGVAGLNAGMQWLLARGTHTVAEHERALCRHMSAALSALDGVEVFAGQGDEQSGVLSFRLRGHECEEAADALSAAGICLRSGLHCAPLAHRSAGTLSTGTLRASFSPFTTESEVDFAVLALADFLRTA